MSNDVEQSDEKSPCVEGKESTSDVSGAVLVSSLIITKALENYEKGHRKEYDSLVQKISDPSLKPVHLQRYLQAMKRCASLLTKKCDILVGTVLKVNWASKDDKTADEFIDFTLTLLSAQTFYLKSCLRMLTRLFVPKVSSGPQEDSEIKEQERVFNNAHNCLQAILELVPTTPKFMLPVLSDNFPYIKKAKNFQTSYVENLLHITKYVPSLREEILECVINHIAKIDVEVPRNELDEPDEEVTQFEVDLETIEEVVINKESIDNEMAESLDALMEILFKYIKDFCLVDGNYHVDSSTELFYQLMTVYEKIILPTHASCHVHFIIFYACSLDQVFVNSFLDFCWKKIENPSVPAILRQASAAYMASIIARANYIPTSTVKLCLDLLVYWVHCYIDAHDASCAGPNASKHGPFYSVCQALFYMFVFKHRALLELDNGHKSIRKFNFERIITSRLNPLKICLPTIVNLFALVTSRHQIVMCYTVIERNKRSLLPIASVQSNKALSRLTVFNQLDSFFPFDPYLLKRSCRYIKPLYQEWEGVEEETTTLHDKEEDQVNNLDFGSEDEDDMEYGKTPDIDVPCFGLDAAMCISPGFVQSPPGR